ncbi:TlpA family protein disulfide reductase [Halocola ammonii]
MANKKKNTFSYVLLVAFAGWLVFYILRYRVAPEIETFEVTFTNIQGDTLSLGDFEGKTTFVNFYASWCGPCMNEMPDLQRSWSKRDQEQTNFVALTDDSWQKINAVRQKFGLTFPVYKLTGSLNDQGIYTIPTSFLFSENGELLQKQTGVVNPEEWLEK